VTDTSTTDTGETADTDAPDSGDPPSCEARDDGQGQVAFRVITPNFPEGVALGTLFGDEGGLLPDGYPVVVVVRGGYAPDEVPVEAPEVAAGYGLLQLYVNFPGGAGPYPTAGADDVRGPAARAALTVALQYAAGTLRDTDGCTLAERVPVPVSSLPPVLHGQSNGGNLVLATLSDEALDVPVLAAATTFETPFSAQLLTVELGQTLNPNPKYLPGRCTWVVEEGMNCDISYGPLGWDASIPQEGVILGAVYFDIDENASWTPEVDYPVYGSRLSDDDGTTTRIAFSPMLTHELQEQSVWDPSFLTPSQGATFWLERDGSRRTAAAATRFPDVPLLVMGTARDHMSSAEDHPHISGLASAWHISGGTWVRVNPDAAYMDAFLGTDFEWSDNAANQELLCGDPRILLEPDELDVGAANGVFVAIGITEMVERAWTGTWTDDLDARLAL